jgi:amino acid permease
MPLNSHEEALLGNPTAADIDYNHQRLDQAPAEKIKIGKWTLVALILNRTIGSGIFLTPHRILAGTGCVGGALFLWVIGAVISLCGLYVWLECGLSMPQRTVRGETEPRGVPRSGGEKNFVSLAFNLTYLMSLAYLVSVGVHVSECQRTSTTHQNYVCF